MPVNWEQENYHTFEEFAQNWNQYYPTLEDFYREEFNPTYFKFNDDELKIDPAILNEDDPAIDEIGKEFSKCINDFAYFCHKYVKINHYKKGLIPFRLYGYQKDLIDSLENNSYNIVKKFRWGGLTTLTAVWGLWKCMFDLDKRVLFITKSDREACYTSYMIERVIDNLPNWLKPILLKQNSHQISFDTGGHLYFRTYHASRGVGANHLIVDEPAFIPEMESHWKALYPVISCGSTCALISTPNGENWFSKTYQAAEEGHNSFNPIKLNFKSHPDYDNDEWTEKMKKNLGPKGWKQEVLCEILKKPKFFKNHWIT